MTNNHDTELPIMFWVAGTRPELIKFSPYLQEFASAYRLILFYTGQHYDRELWSLLLEELEFYKYTEIQAFALEALATYNPTCVCVLGDTNSAVQGAEWADLNKVPLIHFEAGCRSGNVKQIEEQNRILIDGLASLLIAPDEKAQANLLLEGYSSNKIFICKGMGFLPVLRMQKKIASPTISADKPVLQQRSHNEIANGGDREEGRCNVLVTLHRRETLHNSSVLGAFLKSILELSINNLITWPLHPHAEQMIKALGHGYFERLESTKNIRLQPPLAYGKMIKTMLKSDLLITDSGGLQEEAFILGLAVLVARGETEWVRLQRFTGMELCPPDAWDLLAKARDLLKLSPTKIWLERAKEVKTCEDSIERLLDFIRNWV